MATATLTNFYKIRGGKTKEYAVQASVDIRRGDFLTCNAAGAVGQAIALPGSNNTASSTSGGSTLILVADENFTSDASGVSTDGQGRVTIVVRICDDSFETDRRIYNATAANAQQQDLAYDGTSYEYVRYRGATAGDWWYMANTTTTGELIPQDKNKESAVTDNYGIVTYKVAQANRQQG